MLGAAWLTAAASGLLALFAVVTAWYARNAFREQSTEVGILPRQADAQQLLRQADERRREQAARVYVTAIHGCGWKRQPYRNAVRTLTFGAGLD